MNGFERRKEQKRNIILDTAESMFMKDGIQNTSVSDIAKRANVSQVTIYNYFETKNKLVYEVFIYYMDKISYEFTELLNRDISFHEKVKLIISNKMIIATNINQEFYQYIMNEYSSGDYIQKIYQEKSIPLFIQLIEQGKAEGVVDPTLSTESILYFINLLATSMQNEEVYNNILPMTEDIMNMCFYGIYGKPRD